MNFFQKAVARGISPGNVISWLGITAMNFFGALLGTARLKFKAFIFGIKVGKKVRAHGKVGLLRWPGGKISIGNNVSIISSWRRATACSLAFPARLRVFGPGAEIFIDDNAQLSGTSITARSTKIYIGKNVLLGPNCIVVDSDFHAPWPAERRRDSPGMENDRPVSIGDYAWIGMGCIILKGARIGKGAIIGAGSVVTGDIPDNCVACGAPARVKSRGDK